MHSLKFRRQFLLSPGTVKDLASWKIEKIDSHSLHVHPDCQFEKASGVNDAYLIGYFLDPHNPEKNTSAILKEFANIANHEDYFQILYKLIGRFVLIINKNGEFSFFNDACGLKTLYYLHEGDQLIAASQPLLIDLVAPLKKKKAYTEYFNSKYVSRNREHYFPSGISLYENVFQLSPNHYYRTSEKKQIRFWPNSKRQEGSYKEQQPRFAYLLKQIMETANNHLDLAVTLTAGWDSRIILSSTTDIHQELSFYTLRYRNMSGKHRDLTIPTLLSAKLGLNHTVYECQLESTEEFESIYKSSSDLAHFGYWGKIAYGIYKTFPEEKIAVKGNCSEIGRCAYHWGKEEAKGTSDDFLIFQDGWEILEFVKDRIRTWYDDVKMVEAKYNYDPYDLFFWEHRMGSWQAQSQLEWDIAQEVFTPFNSREILDLMLSISTEHRVKKDSDLYKDTMRHFWPEVMSQPINPVSTKQKMYKRIRPILYSTGVLYPLKKIFKRWL